MCHLYGRVLDRDDTGHDVDDPLRVDDHLLPQEVVVEVLHSAEFVQELDGFSDVFLIIDTYTHTKLLVRRITDRIRNCSINSLSQDTPSCHGK